MNRRKNIGLILLPLIFALGIVAGIFMGIYLKQNRLTPGQQKLQTILDLIDREYVDQINTDSLIDASLSGLLASLDPHSAYIAKEDLMAVNDDIEGSFSGVGVSFQIINDSVTVVEVISGGPAEKVGLLPGDRIVKADTVQLSGVGASNEDVFRTLRGPKGTKVTLHIKRTNTRKVHTYDVVRGDIPVNSVDAYYIVEPGVGYVKVSKFSRNTYNEFLDALASLKSDGAKKYIVDLRDNGGGLLDQAILMVNEFLPAGRTIVFTKGRLPENEMLAESDGSGSFQDAELVVLTNEYSASASEIFAGAIQDNDRGLVIGRRTFGKGLVQNQTMLPDSSAIRLTVARYFTPSGRSIQKIYQRGQEGKYLTDIAERYQHGEFYNQDSIKFDKSQTFKTLAGRTVFGGGGIMPDVFVPQDTTGFTSYYINVLNKGLIQRYAFKYIDKYRNAFKNVKTVDQLFSILPDDDALLEDFVTFAADEGGEPARWYYISESHDLLLRQIKAVMARDVIGYDAMNQVLNQADPAMVKALESLRNGIKMTQK